MSKYTLTFKKDTPIWKLYHGLKKAGVKDADLDTGYPETNFVKKERTTVGQNDHRIEETEVLNYALERYESYQRLIKETTDYIVPWSLADLDPSTAFDAEIRAQISKTIKAVETMLTEAGYKKGTNQYEELLGVALFTFAMASQKKSVFAKVKIPSYVEKELMAAKLTRILDHIKVNGGLGIIDFENDCEVEGTALEALKESCGQCSEKSSILYAIFRMAGLKVKFLHAETSFAKRKEDNLPGDTHLSLVLILDKKIRFFDANIIIPATGIMPNPTIETVYKMIFTWWFSITTRETLSAYYSNLGVSYFRKESLDFGRQALITSIQINPYAYESNFALGCSYEKQGKLDLAIISYKKAIELNPRSLKAHSNLGNIYVDKKEFDLAIKLFKRVIEVEPEYADAYYNLGNAHFHKKEFNLAIEAYKKFVELVPDHSQAYYAYYRIGKMYHSLGKFDLAISALKRALALNPSLIDGHFRLGNSYTKQGEYDLAISAYKKAIELKPDFADAILNLGTIYAKQGNFDLAIFELKRVIEMKPMFAQAHYNLAQVYLDKGEQFETSGNIKQALEIYQAVLVEFQLFPLLGLTVSQDELSILRRKIEELGGALDGSEVGRDIEREGRSTREGEFVDLDSAMEALEKESPSAEVAKRYCELGAEYYKKNELAKALSSYQRAANINPNSADAWLGIWNTYKAIGDKENEEKACRKYGEVSGYSGSCDE